MRKPLSILVIITLLSTLCNNIQAQIITTVAGNGISGFGGDGGQASSAKINYPTGVALDAVGNLYIADYGNNCIRKVNTIGIISTFAGNGTANYSGDGGQATAAELNHPNGMVVDAAGNLYIADVFNNCIRKVITSGVISTVVGNGVLGYSGDGGQATASELYHPSQIAFDAIGNMYIADQCNNVIRKVNTLGIISTIVGNGIAAYAGDGGQATACEINYSNGVAFAAGNVYISDQGNSRVRKVNTAGIITTIAGDATQGFSGDGGQATIAELSNPTAISFGCGGNLFISDYGNNRIRKVTISGIISTVVGNGLGAYGGDGGQGTAAEINTPIGITLDAVGNLYIADASNNRVRKVTNVDGGTLTVNSPAICIGDTATLTANEVNTYTWNTGENTSSITVSPTSSSSYTVVGGTGTCLNQVVTTVNVSPIPTVTISGSNTVCPGQNVTLIASGANTYTWNTGEVTESVILNPTVTISYIIIGGINTCTSQAVAVVDVNNVFNSTLPNIVTPNNDGINDYVDFSKYQFSNIQLEIYNRWG